MENGYNKAEQASGLFINRTTGSMTVLLFIYCNDKYSLHFWRYFHGCPYADCRIPAAQGNALLQTLSAVRSSLGHRIRVLSFSQMVIGNSDAVLTDRFPTENTESFFSVFSKGLYQNKLFQTLMVFRTENCTGYFVTNPKYVLAAGETAVCNCFREPACSKEAKRLKDKYRHIHNNLK